MKKLLKWLPVLLIFTACKENTSRVKLERNGAAIAYNRYGNGDTTLLFVHGWCINKEYWQPQADFFSSRYTVVTIDLPGFGQSGKISAGWNFGEYTEDVKTVIEQLKLRNVIVVGHSMSGDMLLDLSNRYPELVTAIVGVDNLHEPAEQMNEQAKKDAAAFFSIFNTRFDSIVSASMGQYLFQPSTDTLIKRRVMQDIFSADSLVATEVLRSLTFFAAEEKSRMQKLNHTLYLVNSDVTPVKIDSLNKYCAKGAKAAYVSGTGHYPMIEKPGAFNTALQGIIMQLGK